MAERRLVERSAIVWGGSAAPSRYQRVQAFKRFVDAIDIAIRERPLSLGSELLDSEDLRTAPKRPVGGRPLLARQEPGSGRI
jgi:hypothetical protein